MAKFKCDCGTHIIEFKYYKKSKRVPKEDLSILIYDIYSPKGRKYKKPKLLADIVLMNNQYPKELDRFFKYINNLKKDKTFINYVFPKDWGIVKFKNNF